MSGHRPKQIASSIRRATQDFLARGINDPRVTGMVTLTRVEVTEDLAIARIYVTVFPEDAEALTMHGLRSVLPRLRRAVMDKVTMKTFPKLEIRVDEGAKAQSEVLDLLARARAREDAASPGGWGPSADSETTPPERTDSSKESDA